MAHPNFRQILGIRFFTGPAAEAVELALRGGLVVVPAAPALVDLTTDPAYREALLASDVALTDSGFMVLLWNLIQRQNITRTSGLEYLKLLIAHPKFLSSSTLWIMPSEKSRDKNLTWLNSRNVPATPADCYIAPTYHATNVTDESLLTVIQSRRPQQIIIALGGGTQEKLGHYIKRSLTLPTRHPPAIHCIGAAIGFLSGDQVNIPDWADHLFLGWIFRCLSQPTRFFPRYWKARRLLPLLLKHREKLPTISTSR
jgi:N-acetylglucosaminyldiphosphoundecaprenol N-acetyl-beta-D-mannosaminyltransferase